MIGFEPSRFYSIFSRPTQFLTIGLFFVSACEDSVGAARSSLIRCVGANDNQVVTVELNAREYEGYMLNCVSGSFVVDMSGCAPDGAYGLSYPTGSAGLRTIVTRWQDFSNHNGGVTSNYLTTTEVRFSGGFHYRGEGYNEKWVFTIDRLTGGAVLDKEGNETRFACQPASQVV